jgi:hypothetical protein
LSFSITGAAVSDLATFATQTFTFPISDVLGLNMFGYCGQSISSAITGFPTCAASCLVSVFVCAVTIVVVVAVILVAGTVPVGMGVNIGVGVRVGVRPVCSVPIVGIVVPRIGSVASLSTLPRWLYRSQSSFRCVDRVCRPGKLFRCGVEPQSLFDQPEG